MLIHQRSRPVERVWHVRARNVVLATGAHERPIAFADNDRPGVMLATSARTFLDRFGVVPGTRAVVFTTNHRGHDAAFALADAGVEIAAIVDVGTAGGPATDAARARGIDVRGGWAVAGTDGESARLRRAPGGSGRRAGHDRRRPAARLRRMEPGRAALARDRRRPPLRRAARVLRPGRDRSALALGRGSRRRRRPDVGAVLVRAGGRLLAPLRGHAARPDGGRRAGRRGARPPLGRAHQARDVHRHGARPGTDVGRAHGRDREPGARRRTGRAGPDERPSAVHAGLVRGARGRRPRPPVRSGARDADPRVARRARRGVRERRAVEASVVLPGRTRRSRWRRRSSAKGWRCGPASA